MVKNTFACTFYEGCDSDNWKVGKGIRQGGVTPGNLFSFYHNDVLTDIANQLTARV